jgi:uncharacterized protein
MPYSPDVSQQVAAAKEAGHELFLHLPMQPERSTADPGPDYLGEGMSPLELHARIIRNLSAFEGYVGVNNHMGSRFTKDAEGLNVLMGALEERQLMFLDSRTTPGSQAEKSARAHHLPVTHRDVFIDHVMSEAAIGESLALVEAVAKHSGAAVAIGHPKGATISALQKWLPTLEEKGFELVPVSKVIELRSAKQQSVAKAQDGKVAQ